MRILILASLLCLAHFANADSTTIENCAYEQSLTMVETISSTVGLTRPKQVQALVGIIQLMCRDVIPANEKDTADTTEAIKTGVVRAIHKVMGDSFAIPGMDTNGTMNVAQSNLLIAIHNYFGDKSITVLNEANLKSVGEAGHEEGLSGDNISLSNGYICSVLSTAPGINAEDDLCAVRLNCKMGSDIKFHSIIHNCELFL